MNIFSTANKPYLVMGRAGIDLYADPPGTCVEHALRFSTALGGSAANIAAGITRLGGMASLASAVSDDAVGRFIINELKSYGIGSTYVATVGGGARTSLAVVETRSEDCQSVIYRNGAADFAMSEGQINDIPFDSFGALIITGTCLAIEPSRTVTFGAIARARQAHMPVILDVDYRPYTWASAQDAAATYSRAADLCDFVIGNDVEFAVMAAGDGKAYARALSQSASKIAIYKMGERGSVTFHNNGCFETGIFRVTAVKPTGAGDAFMAAFVTSLGAGLDLKSSVRRGTAAAAIVVTRVGCAPAMPTAKELDEFLATHSDKG
jgi:5-dehydro-2-deoxygluconokinase